MKTLFLLRHAKAESVSASLRDEDRKLSARGRIACGQIGAYMQSKRYAPQQVLCSTSARTRETLALLEMDGNTSFPCRFEQKLYLATPGEMLTQIQGADDSVDSLLVIGHNPGMHHLAAGLVEAGHTPLHEKLEIKYPTGSLAVITFDTGRWSAIAPETGTLVDFVLPNEL